MKKQKLVEEMPFVLRCSVIFLKNGLGVRRTLGRVAVIKLKELLLNKGMTIRKLSRLSDVRHAAISELANQKRINVHLHHLTRIADVLDIDDMDQIITFEKIED
jgi:putative transcriptional regulator